ncbi:hypothetical protein NKI77_07965 [Mesorhizobium opportunistum]|uniref:Cupin domain-containing protein n=1 Tax=Mesorhizobium opportunistum TaxID=593909 RepID=A0ABV1YBI4_9HYPH|nr:hypothetical protein [Mesorhizobium sp.]TIN90727.1 MAG: hypothetical protein E5Y06_31305 [Mesorhizobium sp.]TJU97907.1 MAG: hypothetical protein E5Y08_16030 [Mesorhizobium sp.]TJV16274.1 MAG: hypothetical protein E5Y07_17835 [Mesorhizobium sp.]
MSLVDIDQATAWDPRLDAIAAAPGNHHVLYEDDVIRVLSVTVAPGESEPVHHHRWPSVFVIDRLAKLRDFDGEGNEIALPFPATFDMPLILKLPPQPAHAVRNEDVVAVHGTRIEFKQGFPK